MFPDVSILLPAFDAESTLAPCLRSIERQTHRSWECIVVDDGSTDGTRACATAFSRRDERFLVRAAGHRGLVSALNAGLPHCRGKYVARMDADDLMHSRRLAEQIGLLDARPELSAIGCHVRVFPREAMGPGQRAYESWINGIDSPDRLRREAFVECPVAHPTLVLRRASIQRLGGYRDLGWPEDYDLVLRLLGRGERIGVLPRRRLAWRHREHRLSRTAPAYSVERFTACKASFLADGFLADADRYVLWGYGATGRGLARALETFGKRPSHIIELHPGRLGNSIRGAPVLPPDRLPDLPRHPLLVSVAGEIPRTRIRHALEAMNFTETRDFICAA